MKKWSIAFGLAFLSTVSIGQSIKAYQLYTADGEEVSVEEMVAVMNQADVVLLGELHNNPIAHWMQVTVTKALYELDSSIVLGAEMFEADNQLILDEYLAGTIKEAHWTEEAKQWNNYKTDYKPLIEFAKAHQLPFIATNIPRRYASLISRAGLEGLDELSDLAYSWMAPIPFPFDADAPGYKEMMEMGMGHGGGMDMTKLVQAQASKDATMAHFILKGIADHEPGTFIHYQGDYHSANQGGIYWYLKSYEPSTKVISLSTTLEEHGAWNEGLSGRADYILVVSPHVTTSY